MQTVGLLFELESGKGKQNDIEAIEEVPDIQATVCLGTIDSQDMDNHFRPRCRVRWRRQVYRGCRLIPPICMCKCVLVDFFIRKE